MRHFILFLSASLLLAACSKPAPTTEPVRAVRVMTMGLDNLHSGLEYSGEVRARIESRVGFRVGGKLVQRQVEVGQRVKAGQVLAQLDPQDLRLSAEAARAQASAAQTQRNLAAADFRRYKDLRDQNFISAAELDRRETTLKAAQSAYEQARAQASVQGRQAGYATLVADVAGVVTAVEAEPGQVLAAGAPVLRIAHDGPRDVVFAVPEDKVGAVRLGAGAKVRSVATAGMFDGVVREVAASADPVTRTYGIKLALQGSDVPPLGSTAYVTPHGRADAGAPVIKLPTSALRQDAGGSAVWLLDRASMTVKTQPVQVATADGNEAVIASGLEPGQTVVTAGVHVLQPGQKVVLFNPAPSPAQAAPVASAPASAASGR